MTITLTSTRAMLAAATGVAGVVAILAAAGRAAGPAGDVCPAASGTANFEHIERVETGTIDHLSGSSTYSDFTGTASEMERGGAYPITVTTDSAWSTDVAGLWIDWNGDGVFDGADETITVAWSGLSPFHAVIGVPAAAALGPTRMRIRLQDGDFDPVPLPCGTTDFGEVEDYTLVVIAGTSPPCPADLEGPDGGPDGDVGFFDLLVALASWGPCLECPADLDGPDGIPDGEVGFFDLLVFLSSWGPCP